MKWKSTFGRDEEESPSPEATDGKKMAMMSDALFDFSLGSSGVIPSNKSADPTFLSPVSIAVAYPCKNNVLYLLS